MTDVVSVSDLKKSFGDQAALGGITFTVSKGEVFGLVGPDGAGKTTTMRILAAVLSADSGAVSVLGLNPVDRKDQIHDRIAYMSQRFGLYGDLTVEENMRFYADLYGVRKEGLRSSMDRLLDWSGLEQFRKRRASKLSGGMKQKLGLSCALIHTPELLLLDEPTNGVDPVSRSEFWALLHRLVDDGLSIVTTTAYLDEAERCHRLAFLNRGLIAASGTPEEITSLIPGGVLSFPSSDPFVDAKRISRVTGAVPTVFGKEVHVMGSFDGNALRGLVSAEVTEKKPSVEDAFVYLTAVGNE